MRKHLPLFILLLALLAGCKKNNPDIYTSAFLRSINGSSTGPVDFSGPIDQMSCSQSYFTGGPSKVSRWMISFHSTLNNNSFTLLLASSDSSNTLPIGKPLSYTYTNGQTSPQTVELSVLDGGSVYSGSANMTLSITFSVFNKKASADFTASLYGDFGSYIITQGNFVDIPINYAQ